MEEMELDMELEDIGHISKRIFKSIVKGKVKDKAFKYLMDKREDRISINSKGKNLKYSELSMAPYLCASEVKISIDEKKWLYKCRIEDIDIETNRRWNNGDLNCNNCENTEINQRHLLECQFLSGKSEIIRSIPDYNDLFKEEIEQQIYISRLLKENHKRMLAQTTK